MNKSKKGFTLIELLIVIAVIGILSAIGLISLNGAREKSRDSKRKSDISSLRTALELWKDDQTGVLDNTFPANTISDKPDLVSSELTVLVPNQVEVLPITPTGVGTANDYWYITNAAAITGDSNIGTYAVNGVFALLTQLESGNKDWYVLNPIGGSVVAGSSVITNLTSANTKCDATTAGTTTIHACLNVPAYSAT